MIFYFSGCGNSRFVAEEIAAKTGDELVFIPEAERAGNYEYTLKEGESLGFVWPVYCWAPPKLVSEFVRKLRIKGGAPYVWLVCTCGDNVGYTEREFRKDLKKAGLGLDFAYSVIMPETYVNMAGMNLDTPEKAAEKVRAANKLLPDVIAQIVAHKQASEMIIGGSPFIKTYITKPYFYRALVTDKKWVLGEACIGCGICASVCPLNNISMSGNKPRWNGNCTTCEACYHACPKNAIQFGKATVGKGQYKFPKL